MTTDPAAIVGGNERVLRARLADAKFFFDQDRKQTLESRLPRLDTIVYHNKLGIAGRARRAVTRARRRPLPARSHADASAADRAAQLAKADLVTEMVAEFPELQGLMGALLRAARWRVAGGRRRDRAALLAALRRR